MIKVRKTYLFVALIGVLFLGIGYYAFRYFVTPVHFEDKNSNGIWDDLEEFIEITAKSPEQKKALEFYLQSFQAILLNPEIDLDARLRKPPVPTIGKARACLRKAWSLTGQFDDLPSGEDAILSSPERIAAYMKYNSSLSGGMYSLWNEEQWGSPCPFEF